MSTVTFQNGKSFNFNGTPTPADIDEVAQTIGIQPDQTSAAAPAPQAPSPDAPPSNLIPAIPSLGPIATPSDTDTSLEAGGKTLLNMVPSTINAVTGLANAAVGGVQTLVEHPLEIPKQIYGLYQDSKGQKGPGGTPGWLSDFVSGLGSAVIPQATRQLVTGDTNGARKTIESDPVGQILPYFMLGRETAYKVSPEAGAAFDDSVSKVAKPGVAAVNTLSSIPGKITSGLSSLGRFGVAQATGLDPSTIKSIVGSPADFSKEGQANLTRPAVAQTIQSALQAREDALSETGQGYNQFRQATGNVPAMIDIKQPDLGSMIQKNTGLVMGKDGTFTPSAMSPVDSPTDVAKINRFYQQWQPYFEQGQMTPAEFLTMRGKLAKIANYEGIGKSSPLESAAAGMRSDLNTNYRPSIPGLEDTDATYSSQITDLKNLSKGILDKDGNLTDTGINKIANSTNKGRSVFLQQIEDISPGISERVKALKAVEDIEKAQGHKVGTYMRAAEGAGGVYALASGNIPALAGVIATTIMSSPDIAVPLMRAYGNVSGLADAVISKLKSGASVLNQSPQGAGSFSGLVPRKISAPSP